MDELIFSDLINGRAKKVTTPMTIARLKEIEKVAPDKISRFLGALRGGAGFAAAAGLLGMSPETIKRWMGRGASARSGPYRQFYLSVISALQVATTLAEVKVKEMNPLKWLQNGPGRYVTDDWHEQPRKVEVDVDQSVQVQGGYTVEGKVQVQHVDVISALKELKAAGISLDSLTLEAVKIQQRDEAEDDGDPDDENEATSVGTNYIGHGKHHSYNPSLPSKMREAVEAIEVHPSKSQDLEGVGVTVPSLADRLRAMRGR
jgi:hypothetical protein